MKLFLKIILTPSLIIINISLFEELFKYPPKKKQGTEIEKQQKLLINIIRAENKKTRHSHTLHNVVDIINKAKQGEEYGINEIKCCCCRVHEV